MQSLGAYKNKNDRDKKEKEYIGNLRRRAKLDKDYEKAIIERTKTEKFGLPTYTPEKSLEDEQADVIYQTNLALKNLSTIMKPQQAKRALDLFRPDEYFRLNSLFGKIAKELEGRKNISATFFRQAYDRYIELLKTTGDTAIAIPLREESLAKLSEDLRDKWLEWSLKYIDPSTGATYSLPELIKETAVYLGRSIEDLKAEIKYSGGGEGESYEKPYKTPPAQVSPPRSTQSVGVISDIVLLNKMKTIFDDILPSSLTDRSFSRDQAEDIFNQITTRGLPLEKLGAKNIREIAKPILGVDTLSVTKNNKADIIRQINETLGRGRGGAQEEKVSQSGSGGKRGGINKKGRLKVVFGKGVDVSSSEYEDKVRYKKFGKYFVEMEKLGNEPHTLIVKYKSNTPVVDIPRKSVSKDLADTIASVIDKGILEKSKYNKLNDDDQHYFTILVRKCGLTKTLGLSSLSEKERSDMKRFDLLKGEIIAGNTNKDVINELKSFIIKFLNDGTLNRKYGNDLLIQLSLLDKN